MNLRRLRLRIWFAAFSSAFVNRLENFVLLASGSNRNHLTREMNKSGRYCSGRRIARCSNAWDEESLPTAIHSFVVRSLSALAITETELKLMAAAANIGFRSSPKSGNSTPAASGTATEL